MATFTVTNLDAGGPGSLRRAIQRANATPGADTISFNVAGTIQVRQAGLPAITDRVAIDGASAPSFNGTPRVTVDFHGRPGFQFNRGSQGSALSSLAIVRASGAGVTLNAPSITIQGNIIGLRADGRTRAGNHGDGVRINPTSRDNLIGNDNAVSGIDYFTADGVSIQPVTAWQGVRAADDAGQYLITGTSSTDGLLYVGPISGVGGTSFKVNVPGSTSTSVYGPDNLDEGLVRLVGSYRVSADDRVRGFVFDGTSADLPSGGTYRTIAYPDAQFTYAHSTMGDLVVGNADGFPIGPPLGPGRAWLYDISAGRFLGDISYPDATSTTAYGIWWNGDTSYTICGGFASLSDGRPISRAFVVDYDSATNAYSNWAPFEYPNGLAGQDFITHFEGISGTQKGTYTLVADSLERGATGPAQGSHVTIRRTTAGGFIQADSAWVDLDYPGTGGISSANSVFGQQVVGIVIPSTSSVGPFQATINVGFQLSNVIAANGGNGVGIYGSSGNRVAMNHIGTDVSGTLARGNRWHGVLMTDGAARNFIGGEATGGNDPTKGVFVRPPQGNLISANGADGVRIEHRASRNQLSGNFIGTTADGNSALGNHGDGVAIVGARDNRLIGCTFQQDPFVFYNVISGNRGGGLRVHDSEGTLIQANFLGVGANNSVRVPNHANGLTVSGHSRNTLTGGLIPLGNVISGNDGHGIEVRDHASGFTSYNTFGGTFAFGGAAPNGGDGIRITTSGRDVLVIVNVFSGNRGDGVSIGGHANGVQVVESIVGLHTNVQSVVPNGGSGIRIWGHARNSRIGGPAPEHVPGGRPVVTDLPVFVSGNLGFGIVVTGWARDNTIIGAIVGTNLTGTAEFGNGLGGIDLGPGTRGTRLGGTAEHERTRVVFNQGNGLSIRSSREDHVRGVEIVANQGYGLFAIGDCFGTVVRDSPIRRNGAGNVNISRAKGIIYVPVTRS